MYSTCFLILFWPGNTFVALESYITGMKTLASFMSFPSLECTFFLFRAAKMHVLWTLDKASYSVKGIACKHAHSLLCWYCLTKTHDTHLLLESVHTFLLITMLHRLHSPVPRTLLHPYNLLLEAGKEHVNLMFVLPSSFPSRLIPRQSRRSPIWGKVHLKATRVHTWQQKPEMLKVNRQVKIFRDGWRGYSNGTESSPQTAQHMQKKTGDRKSVV